MDLDKITSSALVYPFLGTLLPVTWCSGRSRSHYLVIISSTLLHGTSLPGPGTVAGPFSRTRGTWVSLPAAWHNGRPPFPPFCIFSSFPHPPGPRGPAPGYTHDMHLNCQLSLVFGHQAFVNKSHRDLTTCLIFVQPRKQTTVFF